MKKEDNMIVKKLLFEDFIQEDRFELNLYLTYLLNEVKISK